MRTIKNLIWIGAVFSILTGGMAIVKLYAQFVDIGFVGVPALVLSAYTNFVDQVQKYLVEIPFNIKPPPWVKHLVAIWTIFCGTNWYFLKGNSRGNLLLTGIFDYGRGLRRGSIKKEILYIYFFLIAISGPLFSIFVFLMWLGNLKPGPSGQGRWGDHLMVGNRLYTRRISGIYLLILILQPVCAIVWLVWNSVSS